MAGRKIASNQIYENWIRVLFYIERKFPVIKLDVQQFIRGFTEEILHSNCVTK